MSGTLGELQNALRGGDVLSSIANPQVVNPLAAYSSAADAAGKVWNIRKYQAEQAQGQAAIDAINRETGQMDPVKYGQGMIAAGPTAALGAQSSMQAGQTLTKDQYDLHNKQYTGMMSSMAQLLVDYPNGPPKAAIDAAIQNGVSTGLIQPHQATQFSSAFGDSAQTNARTILQGMTRNLTGQEQLDTVRPKAPLVTTGNAAVPIQPEPQVGSAPYTGAPTQRPGGVKLGPPAGTMQPSVEPEIGADGKPTGRQVTVTRPLVEAAPSTQGTQPITAPGAKPRLGEPGYTGRPTPPAPGLGNPNNPAQSPSAPGAAPSPAASAPIVTAPPQGQPEKQKADVAAYTEDQAQYGNVQTRAQNMAHAYTALQMLQSATGRGAEGINAVRSYAQTLGLLPPGAVSEQKLFEIVHKYTERAMIDAAGGGSTDLGKKMQEQANAGTLLSTPANLEIMRNDMGKTLQTMAAYKDHKDTSGTGYLEGRAKLADTTDPRGFAWDLYTPSEQARINAEVDKDPAAADKLHKAIGMSRRLKLQIPGLTLPQAGQKQSFVAPPESASNPLAAYG